MSDYQPVDHIPESNHNFDAQSVVDTALRLFSEDPPVTEDRFITLGDGWTIRVSAGELEAQRQERIRNQKVLDTLNHKKTVDQAAVREFHGSLAVRNLHVSQDGFETRDGQSYVVKPIKVMGQVTGRRIERRWDRKAKPAKCSACGRKHRASLGCRP